MKLSLRNGVWQVSFYDEAGNRQRKSTGKRDKREAELEAARIIAGKPSGNALDGSSGMTLGDALNRTADEVWGNHKSWANLRSMLKQVATELGHLPVEQVTHGKLQEYGQKLKANGAANATVNRKLSMVSKALRMCTIWEKPDGSPYLRYVPPIPRYSEDNQKERFVSEAEEAAILSFCRTQYQTTGHPQWWLMERLVGFLLDTGCRLSEALNFRPSEATGDIVIIHAAQSKTGRTRSVPMTNRVRGIVNELRMGPYAHSGFAIDKWWAWKLWDNIREGVAGLDGVTLHTLRHTCASRLVQRGIPLYTVRDWLGHTDAKTTQRYAHLSVDSLEAARKALERPALRLVS